MRSIGKHRDEWAREIIAELVLLGRQISADLPLKVETESKVHRGFIDVAWFAKSPSTKEKLYLCVFEIETSKNDWVRIRSNSAKLVLLNPALVSHVFKPGVRLTTAERNELKKIHSSRRCYVINTRKALNDLLRDLASFFSKRKKLGDYTRIKLELHRDDSAQVKKLVESGRYETADEFIRISMSEYIAKVYGIPVYKYSPCSMCGSHRVFFDHEIKSAICLNCGGIKRIPDWRRRIHASP